MPETFGGEGAPEDLMIQVLDENFDPKDENSTVSMRLSWSHAASSKHNNEGDNNNSTHKMFQVLQISIDQKSGRKICRLHMAHSQAVFLCGIRPKFKYQFAVKCADSPYSLPVTLNLVNSNEAATTTSPHAGGARKG